MAFNFEKTKAMFAQELDADTKENLQLKLKDNDLGIIAADLVEDSLLAMTAEKARVDLVESGSITFHKIPYPVLKQKTNIGSPIDTTGDDVVFNTVTIRFQRPYYARHQLSKADIARGVPECLTELQAMDANAWLNQTEEEGFNTLETKAKAVSIDFSKLDIQAINEEIVKQAVALTQLVDKDDGIKRIRRENIIVFVKPELLSKLATIGVVGSAAQKYFEGGQYAVTTIAGFNFVSNPYLVNAEALICTNFSCGLGRKILAMNLTNLGETNDLVSYYEAQYCFDVLFKNTIIAIKNEAVAEKPVVGNETAKKSKSKNNADTEEITEAPTK